MFLPLLFNLLAHACAEDSGSNLILFVIVVVIVDSCFFLLEAIPFLSNLLPSNLITD